MNSPGDMSSGVGIRIWVGKPKNYIIFQTYSLQKSEWAIAQPFPSCPPSSYASEMKYATKEKPPNCSQNW